MACASSSASATRGRVGGAERVVDQLEHLALAELADVHDQLAHRLEQRPRAREVRRRSPPAMIVSVPSSARGEEPVTGASIMLAPRSASAAADAPRVGRGDRRAVDAQQTRRAPPRSRRRAPSSTEATCSPSTTMLKTMSLAAATSAGVSNARAPCSAAQACGLAGSVRPDRELVARAGQVGGHARAHDPEPEEPDPLSPPRSLMRRILPHRGFRCAAAGPAAACRWPSPAAARPSSSVAPGGSVAAAARPRAGAWRRRSAISEKLISSSASQLAHDAVAAAVTARAARAAAQRVLDDAQRELALERLDRRVQRVAHRDVHAARPVGVRARALAAAERLVVGEALVAEREVVHRALALRAPERAQHEIGDARGGLDVAGRDRCARAARSGRCPAGARTSTGR